MTTTLSILLIIAAMYMVLGNVFSILFLWKGLDKVDPGTKDSGIIFKLLLYPGMTIFWPFFLTKWKFDS